MQIGDGLAYESVPQRGRARAPHPTESQAQSIRDVAMTWTHAGG